MFYEIFSLKEIFELKSIFFNLLIITCIMLNSYMLIKYSFFFTPKRIDMEKTSSYECGFNPYIQSRTKFDFKFYIISTIFLVFDIEIVLLLPIGLLLLYIITKLSLIYVFLFILIFGLVIELSAKLFA
jgi:NADH-quinone oxidoreductase subunit A